MFLWHSVSHSRLRSHYRKKLSLTHLWVSWLHHTDGLHSVALDPDEINWVGLLKIGSRLNYEAELVV